MPGLTSDQLAQIRSMRQEGRGADEIARALSVPVSANTRSPAPPRDAHLVSALEERSAGTLDAALERQRERPELRVTVVDSRVPAREGQHPGLSGKPSQTPLGDRLRQVISDDPSVIADVYVEALSATKWERGVGDWVPDIPTRLRAADSVANRAEGMPTARTELTGADGGPVTLAALLCVDVNDSI